MEVSFFAGIAGKKKEAVEVGTLVREVQAQLLWKGKKSSVLLGPGGLSVGWEADWEGGLHVRAEKRRFSGVFRWFNVWDRSGRARVGCALTRKHGGTARGSQSSAARRSSGPELSGAGVGFVLKLTKQVRTPGVTGVSVFVINTVIVWTKWNLKGPEAPAATQAETWKDKKLSWCLKKRQKISEISRGNKSYVV